MDRERPDYARKHALFSEESREGDPFPLLEQGTEDADLVDEALAHFNPQILGALDPLLLKECEMGLDGRQCDGPFEECQQVLAKSRQGICACISGFVSNARGECVSAFAVTRQPGSFSASPFLKSNAAVAATSALQPTQITVSVASTTVRLPEKEATLSAFTIPDEKAAGDRYRYAWNLISQPKETPSNGTISDQTKERILLANLSEGVYRFKVTVNGTNAYGEAEANVTVLPESRVSRPPQVVVTPKSQTLKLPNAQAILDGHTEEDSRIVSWHWDLVEGPIGYEAAALPETNTLQLTDLDLPGNYTFKLTVVDAQSVQNWTTASINVLKGTDYPPEANAVPNVMIRLPQNSIVLNGSQSTDDRGIVAWEWTKDQSDESASSAGAVDMQDTRTPYLRLSNLEEGTYRFVLKVTDASGQTGNTSVMVFVKPSLNSPPTADAGPDQVRFGILKKSRNVRFTSISYSFYSSTESHL